MGIRVSSATLLVALATFFNTSECCQVRADETVNGDLTVVGHAEIGDDAGTTGFFGNDTLRLAGERVRLKLIDTSATGTTSDWRLRINNGGGNINGFFIDDMGDNNNDGAENGHVSTPFKIEAGASDNSLVVSDVNKPGNTGARIGLGTDSPTAPLHIVNGATPAIRLERTDAIDSPYIWAIAGAFPQFNLRDITSNQIPFVVRATARDNSIYVSEISSGGGGRIGLGTSTPLDDLHIAGGFGSNIFLGASSAHNWRIEADNFFSIENADNGDAPFFIQDDAPDLALGIEESGDVGIGILNPLADLHIQRGGTFSRVNAGDTTFTVSSSRELKQNIQPFAVANLIDKVMRVSVRNYDWKPECFEGEEKDRTDRIGLIAEDFHQVLGRGSEKEINGHEVQSVLWMAVQELAEENRTLKEQLNKSEADFAARLQRIEAVIDQKFASASDSKP